MITKDIIDEINKGNQQYDEIVIEVFRSGNIEEYNFIADNVSSVELHRLANKAIRRPDGRDTLTHMKELIIKRVNLRQYKKNI